MTDLSKFISSLDASYQFSGSSILLGAGMIDGVAQTNHHVRVPLKTMTRHGLIAGATGTGKTKSLQLLAEGLSNNGVPTLLMDIKGDLSGIAQPGITNPKIEERAGKIGFAWNASQFPVELLTLSKQPGARLRATVTEFGPVLFAKILDLNETQEGLLALIFKYCDDKKLPLVDLEDLKKVLQYIQDDGKSEVQESYGNISPASAGTILRKIIELEQQGAAPFFGEPSFDPHDLLRTDINGKGIIHILRLTDIQDRPKLFSTFMLSLLAEVYHGFPEVGDPDKPKLVIFIDEAHLIFNEASKSLLDQIETTIKLIRSKGVGVFFCTQNPQDIPSPVLSQLGMKVQHALRAFTAIDRKTIVTASQNFPESEFYKTDEIITQLGIGEALVTALNEKGIPTMLAATLMCPPASCMDVLQEMEINELVSRSKLAGIYNQTIDRQSAFEILQERMKGKSADDKQDKKSSEPRSREKSTLDKMLHSPVVKSVANEITRGLLGSLGIKTRKRNFFS